MLLNCGVGEDTWRVPWTARRSNQSILKEISPEYSLEGLMLKLKLQYFGHLMQRTDSLEKTFQEDWEILKAGEEGDDREWDGWMASLTWWTWVWASSGRWWWTEKPGILQSMGSQRVGHDWATELNWAIRGASFCQSVCSLCPENCVCVWWEDQKAKGNQELSSKCGMRGYSDLQKGWIFTVKWFAPSYFK